MPDVIVNCGEPRGARTTSRSAAAIVEVISPSTSGHDKVDKLETYFLLPELQTVLLTEQATMHVTAYTRSPKGWLLQIHEHADSVVEFEALGVKLSLAQIYEDVELDA